MENSVRSSSSSVRWNCTRSQLHGSLIFAQSTMKGALSSLAQDNRMELGVKQTEIKHFAETCSKMIRCMCNHVNARALRNVV